MEGFTHLKITNRLGSNYCLFMHLLALLDTAFVGVAAALGCGYEVKLKFIIQSEMCLAAQKQITDNIRNIEMF